ncbi:MAG: peptidase M48 Ste24p [Sphingobium sp.]|jgi:predicted Zn-dependent protease|nr:MAG: peptidase M48 Ste24p [Sphingobium sp.]
MAKPAWWSVAALGAVAVTVGPAATGRQPTTYSAISASDKAQGAKAHPALVQEYGGAYQGPQVAYVTAVARKVAVQSGLSNAAGDFTVTLLNSPVNNAFAIPGGYIYITRQLMALANDEAEMAGVLGHEIGHVAARHSQRRQQASQRNAIGGLLLQVLTGAVVGDSALGGMLQKGIGQGSQLLTLRFSRTQEYEADDLGIRYLAKAGYDPSAMASMLASLAAQSALDQQAAGDARSVPEWASTHPDPQARVARAAQRARETKSTNTLVNRDAFLNAVNGLLYGDDPKQGVISGRSFLHPDLKLAFTAPGGFGMENGAQAVSIAGSGGQAQFSGARYSGDLQAYVQSVFGGLSEKGVGQIDAIRRTTVNGLPAGWLTLRANTGSQQVDITVFAYEFGPGTAYHFLLVTPAGQGIGPFSDMVGSLRRLNGDEAAKIRPRRVSVVTVRSGDTIASLSARMAYPELKTERFLTLNGLSAEDTLRPGERMKLIVE